LSYLTRDTHRSRRGAVSPGDSVGVIRMSQGENGWPGTAETGAQGASSSRGGDQDLEMWKEPRSVWLMEAVVHTSCDQVGVSGMQAENQAPSGSHVECRVG
jgi:hypothetical protein